MLILCKKKDRRPIAVFENYKDLYLHIVHQENLKLLENHPEFGQSYWSFIVHPAENIAELINIRRTSHGAQILFEAWGQQVGLVEMCEGDYKNMRQVPLTPNINVEALREDWCLDYCEAYGMSVIEAEEYFKSRKPEV